MPNRGYTGVTHSATIIAGQNQEKGLEMNIGG